MGACQSPTPEHQVSRAINADINTDRDKQTSTSKILFLGSGGSGKSTIFKQLRLIHGDGYSDSDRKDYIPLIHTQIITQMKAILRIYIDYNHRKQQRDNVDGDDEKDDELLMYDTLPLQSSNLNDMESAELVMNYVYDRNHHTIPSEICDAIKSLWSERVVKEIYSFRKVTNIETSSAHFWDKMDQVQDVNYLPSTEDILLNRIVTTGLHEQQFKIQRNGTNATTMHIIDVGGQRSQRRKWIHCFEHVVAVIFIASLSCYDAMMMEDPSTNAMSDQLALFDEICNHYILRRVSMILFANKKDLFRQTYCEEKVPLSVCDEFETFSDDRWDYNKAMEYILERFREMNKSIAKEVFTHVTCATDTNNIEMVFNDVQQIIVGGTLARTGLMD
eukprot:94818_1